MSKAPKRPPSGHGISAAVRNYVPTWISLEVIDAVFDELKKTDPKASKGTLSLAMREKENWPKEKAHGTPAGGRERIFYNTALGKKCPIRLVVHSPKVPKGKKDETADSFVLTVNGKPVAGGKTKLKSVFKSAVVVDKAGVTAISGDHFEPLSPEELQTLETRAKYGDGLDQLEFERVI